ncbi:zinc metalloprotease HtpX [Wukongibacter sp. M2B1]|uniref:zinc metalloprotease HtpX n=1 Tax=Wukongibacter sp. M2B1 TaxID=3088895 RepID=UPI003D79F654
MKNYYKMMLRRTLLLMTILFGVVFAVATAIIWKLGLNISYGILVSVVVVGLQFLLGPWIIDTIYKVELDDPRIYDNPDLIYNNISSEIIDFIENTCKEVGIPKPKIGVIDDGNPNAFTYGHIPRNARLVLTTGITEVLDEEELKSVIAHEIGHIKHYDFIAMMVVSLIPMILYQIYISTRNRKGNSAYLIGLGAYVVYILSGFLVLAFSRMREFYADSFSKNIMGSGEQLKSALLKIAYGTASREQGKQPKVSTMAFANNIQNDALLLTTYKLDYKDKINKTLMRWDIKNIWGKWYEVNSTHPLTAKRIMALTGETVEDSRMSKKDIGQFLFEMFMNLLPWIFLGIAVFTSKEITMKDSGIIRTLLSILKNNPLNLSLLGVCILAKYYYSYRKGDKEYKIYDLLLREDASPVKGIPGILKGKIIGKGIPGLFYSEDFVLDDGTGIMFIDYRQPLRILEFLFGVCKADEMIEKDVEIIGWYKRGIRPYFVCRYIIKDGKKIISFNFILKQLLGYVLLTAGIIISLI